MKFFKFKYLLLVFFTTSTLFSCLEEPLEDPIDDEQSTNIDLTPEEEDQTSADKPETPTDKSEDPETPKTSSQNAPSDTSKINEETPLSSKTEAEEVLRLVNLERNKNGLSTLVLNDALNTAAFKHSEDMRLQNYFDHEGKDGSDFSQRAKRAGYTGFPTGENIAAGYRTSKQVFDGWMSSKGHRENILSPNHTEMGLGRSGNLWTQVFGVAR